MKRAVYENLSKNFDIFEFLTDQPPNKRPRSNLKSSKSRTEEAPQDQNASEELEFKIDDDDDQRIESMFYDQIASRNAR
jgi:hypothetical protein